MQSLTDPAGRLQQEGIDLKAPGKRKLEIAEKRYLSTSKGLKWIYSQLLDRYLEYSKVAKKASTYETDTY